MQTGSSDELLHETPHRAALIDHIIIHAQLPLIARVLCQETLPWHASPLRGHKQRPDTRASSRFLRQPAAAGTARPVGATLAESSSWQTNDDNSGCRPVGRRLLRQQLQLLLMLNWKRMKQRLLQRVTGCWGIPCPLKLRHLLLMPEIWTPLQLSSRQGEMLAKVVPSLC